MSSVIAIVKSIIGQVFALSADGVQRLLVEGDRLFAGEQVMTGATGMLTLQLADGRSLDLGRDSQWSAEANSAPAAAPTPATGTSADELVQAIAAGLDPTAELPATAAGGAGGGTGGAGGIGGGHSFVALDATAQRLDPTVGYPTAGLDFAAERVDERIGVAGDGTNGNAPTDANTVAPLVPIAPVAADDMGSSVSEDGSISIDVLGNDSDSDGTLNPASVQISGTANPGDSLVVAGQGIWSVNTSTGAISFTPLPNYAGPVTSITYSVADNDGLRSNTATVDMSINAVNDAPVAVSNLGNSVSEDGSISIAVLGNDSDSDGTLNPASVQITGTINPGDSLVVVGQGTWSVNTSTGAISFTPLPNYTGPVTSITYSVADNDGLRSNTATVDMIMANPNIDAPDANVTFGTSTLITTTINATNVKGVGSGFTVSAVSLDGTDTISIRDQGTPTGFGVAGKTPDGDAKEIGHNGTTSEKLIIVFDHDIASASIRFAWMRPKESAEYKLFDSLGKLIGGAIVNGVTDVIDPVITIASTNGSLIHRIEFTAPTTATGENGQQNDYLIHDISYVSSATRPMTITATPDDVINGESISAISVSIPTGATLSAGTWNSSDKTWSLDLNETVKYKVDVDPATKAVTISGLEIALPPGVAGTPNVTVIATVSDGSPTVDTFKAFIGSSGNDLINGTADDDILRGGLGSDQLTGGDGADRFVWRAGDKGNDVIKDFNTADGDRIDLRELLIGETDGTLDNFLQMVTSGGSTTLLISSTGLLNTGGDPASHTDATIKLDSLDLSSSSISSLIAGADPTIKVDHS